MQRTIKTAGVAHNYIDRVLQHNHSNRFSWVGSVWKESFVPKYINTVQWKCNVKSLKISLKHKWLQTQFPVFSKDVPQHCSKLFFSNRRTESLLNLWKISTLWIPETMGSIPRALCRMSSTRSHPWCSWDPVGLFYQKVYKKRKQNSSRVE